MSNTFFQGGEKISLRGLSPPEPPLVMRLIYTLSQMKT